MREEMIQAQKEILRMRTVNIPILTSALPMALALALAFVLPLVSMGFYSLGASAAGSSGVSETTGNTNTNGTGKTSSGTGQMTTPAPSSPSSAGSQQPSINQSAKKGNSSQMIGGLINGVVGAGLTTYGVQSKNNMMIMMGVMALGQAAASLAAAGQSAGSGDASAAGWGDYSLSPGAEGQGNGSGSTDLSSTAAGAGITPSGLQNQIKEGLKTLSAQGVHLDLAAKTVTMPDGTKKSLDAFKDAASMAAAGFPSSQSAAALAAADKLTKEALAKYGGDAPRVSAVAVESGGGGEGSGSYSNSNSDDGMSNYMARMNRGLSAADRARMIAGKSILAGGEPIGVKGDDIFQMIHRHYDLKRKGNEFIEIAEASPVVRSKASIQKGFVAPKK